MGIPQNGWFIVKNPLESVDKKQLMEHKESARCLLLTATVGQL